MFGKRLSDYLGFQKPFLGLIAAVGLVRLALSLAGLPDATVAWLSMTAVALTGAVYYGVAAHTRGFDRYNQLLPLVFFQSAVANFIAVLGIVLSVAGLHNIYAASEYSGPFARMQWAHIVGHLTAGMIVPSLAMWGVASLVMLVTRKLSARPAVA